MALFWSLFPVYLAGNLHCIGMCGPLVMMLGRHNARYWYFIGRATSFTLAGGAAGWLGQELSFGDIQPAISFFFGVALLFFGMAQLFSLSLPRLPLLSRMKGELDQRLTLLLLRGSATATFLFGLATVLLPCGQTLVVFSACALSGSVSVGLLNGFSFALLTSPSLWLAMQAHSLLNAARRYYRPILGTLLILSGCWMMYRGRGFFHEEPVGCPMCHEKSIPLAS